MTLGDPKHLINQIGYFLNAHEDNLCNDDFYKVDDFRKFLEGLDLKESKKARKIERGSAWITRMR